MSTRPDPTSRGVLLLGSLLLGITAFAGCAGAGNGPADALSAQTHAAAVNDMLDSSLTMGDFQPLFDRLADDVVLQVRTTREGAVHREIRGKRAVMRFFLNESNATFRRESTRPSVLADFRHGWITRFLVIQDNR